MKRPQLHLLRRYLQLPFSLGALVDVLIAIAALAIAMSLFTNCL